MLGSSPAYTPTSITLLHLLQYMLTYIVPEPFCMKDFISYAIIYS